MFENRDEVDHVASGSSRGRHGEQSPFSPSDVDIVWGLDIDAIGCLENECAGCPVRGCIVSLDAYGLNLGHREERVLWAYIHPCMVTEMLRILKQAEKEYPVMFQEVRPMQVNLARSECLSEQLASFYKWLSRRGM